MYVTPAGRGKGRKTLENNSPSERHRVMTWAQRLKRVFRIDIETCNQCGGAVKVIACIEDQAVIDKFLAHLKDKARHTAESPCLPEPRAPPPTTLLD